MNPVELRAALADERSARQNAEASLVDCQRQLGDAHRTIRAMELAAVAAAYIGGVNAFAARWLPEPFIGGPPIDDDQMLGQIRG